MSFWDASAVIPLCVKEPRLSEEMWEMLAAQPMVVTWWGTPVELAVMFMQQVRAGTMTLDAAHRALDIVERLREAWVEIVSSRGCYFRARRIAQLHELPVTSTLQLAAALTWVRPRPPHRHAFVSLDPRLREAAAKEGFRLLPEKLPPARRCVPGSDDPHRVVA